MSVPSRIAVGLAIATAWLALLYVAAARHEHWLALTSLAQQTALARGAHPQSVDFAWLARHPAPRGFLSAGPEVQLTLSENGLDVEANTSGFLLKPKSWNSHGFAPSQVGGLTLEFLALTSAQASLSLQVYADGAHWTAELPSEWKDINLSALRFLREPARNVEQSWTQFQHIAHAQIFVALAADVELPKHFTWQRLTYTAALPAQTVALDSIWPEARLRAADQIRYSGATTPVVNLGTNTGYWFTHLQSWIVLKFGALFLLLSLLIKPRSAQLLLAQVAWIAPSVLLWWGDAHVFDHSARIAVLCAIITAAVWRVYSLSTRTNSDFQIFPPAKALLAFAAANLVVVVALLLLTKKLPSVDFKLALIYLAFATVQQWLLQRVLLRGFASVMSTGTAIALATLCFSALHMPNFSLMLLCTTAAVGWCSAHRAGIPFWCLALSHACLGWLVIELLPSDVLRGADVAVQHFQNVPLR